MVTDSLLMYCRFLWFVLTLLVCGSAAAAPRPVLVLGDSLSAAHGIAVESGWVNLLAERLQKSPQTRAVVNASISGETTSGGLARLPNLLSESHPALVVVELGANDALRGLPIAEIKSNLARIIAASRAADARVVLLGIELPINYGPRYRDDLRSMYRDLASEFKLPLLPFLLDGVALDPNLMQADGLHPTAAAQPRVLENVCSVLIPVLNKLPES
ncbi:MAG: arylesterase [Dokdonella sp.]